MIRQAGDLSMSSIEDPASLFFHGTRGERNLWRLGITTLSAIREARCRLGWNWTRNAVN